MKPQLFTELEVKAMSIKSKFETSKTDKQIYEVLKLLLLQRPHKEISERLNVNRNTIKLIAFRYKQELKTAIKGFDSQLYNAQTLGVYMGDSLLEANINYYTKLNK